MGISSFGVELRDLQKMHRCRHAVAKVHLGLLIEILSLGSKQKDPFLNFFCDSMESSVKTFYYNVH